MHNYFRPYLAEIKGVFLELTVGNSTVCGYQNTANYVLGVCVYGLASHYTLISYI